MKILTHFHGDLWYSDKPFPVKPNIWESSCIDKGEINNKLAAKHGRELADWLSTAYKVVNPEVMRPRACTEESLKDGDQITLPDGYDIKTKAYRQRGEVNGPKYKEATIITTEGADVPAQKDQDTTPDYTKGCARYKEITCDCDLMANECKGKDFELTSLRQQIQEKGDEIKDLNTSNSQLVAMYEEKTSENAELRRELETLKEQVKNQDWTLINRLNEIQMRRNQVDTFREALTSAQDQRDKLTVELFERDKAWNEAIDSAMTLFNADRYFNDPTYDLKEELKKLKR